MAEQWETAVQRGGHDDAVKRAICTAGPCSARNSIRMDKRAISTSHHHMSCSCPDYGKYRGHIRPCKHVVALRDAHRAPRGCRGEIRNAEAQGQAGTGAE